MKFIEVITGCKTVDNGATAWLEKKTQRFLCTGNNCDACELKFKCYTEDEFEIIEIEVSGFSRLFEPPSALVNKLTHSKVYREGTKKYREYAPITYRAKAW